MLSEKDAALIRTEFPEFDLATLPAIPSGFTCAAWRNDTCPIWYEGDITELEAGKLMIAVDFADARLREFEEGERFTLQMVKVADSSPEPVLSSDKWEDIENAVRFIRYVKALGLAFNPDTRGADYINEDGSRTFSDAEAAEYDTTIRAYPGDAYQLGIEVWEALGLTNDRG